MIKNNVNKCILERKKKVSGNNTIFVPLGFPRARAFFGDEFGKTTFISRKTNARDKRFVKGYCFVCNSEVYSI